MQWRFWQKQRQDTKVPAGVGRAIQKQYGLDTQALDRLCCLSRPGSFTGRPVKLIRVYDPAFVTHVGKVVEKYEDLTDLREALVFEGHIEPDGSVYLVDRRAKTPRLARGS